MVMAIKSPCRDARALAYGAGCLPVSLWDNPHDSLLQKFTMSPCEEELSGYLAPPLRGIHHNLYPM